MPPHSARRNRRNRHHPPPPDTLATSPCHARTTPNTSDTPASTFSEEEPQQEGQCCVGVHTSLGIGAVLCVCPQRALSASEGATGWGHATAVHAHPALIAPQRPRNKSQTVVVVWPCARDFSGALGDRGLMCSGTRVKSRASLAYESSGGRPRPSRALVAQHLTPTLMLDLPVSLFQTGLSPPSTAVLDSSLTPLVAPPSSPSSSCSDVEQPSFEWCRRRSSQQHSLHSCRHERRRQLVECGRRLAEDRRGPEQAQLRAIRHGR